jgi:hypothetical protein
LPTLQFPLLKMKKLFSPIVLLMAIVVIAGCSTKFNIGAPYKNVTVVYGFLDASDTAHYIRIQKAFLSQNQSAITMAQTADSSFYANLDVRINRINAVTGAFYDTIHLNRVDLDLEGYPKQPGAFFTAPNYAYKFKNQLDSNYFYQLEITNLATGAIDSSDAVGAAVIDTSRSVFTINQLDVIGFNLGGMDFATTGANDQGVTIQGAYAPADPLEANPVSIVQAVITFNWYDSNVVTKTVTPNSYAYNLGYSNYGSNGIYYNPYNLTLYQALFTGMGVAPANIYRLLDRCDITVYASTNDFSLYEQAALTQGTGLTGSDIEPEYTNIKGANTLGLYTSRGFRTGLITITPDTIDSLIASPYMKPTNIAGTIYQ